MSTNEIEQLREDRDAFRASSDIRGAEVERLTARVAELERALLLIEPSGDFSGWEDRDGNDIGAVINAALAKDGDL